MFHRIGAAAYKADLTNIIALSAILHHPEKKIRSIHVAGTNGKGSVSHMLASILQEAGYKTGLFTSPHLKDFRERIRINGKMIDEKTVINFIEQYGNLFEKINPSFFEWTTALAFQYFSEEEVDIAVIETGLGGRLDSTNIINPELSVITNISFDHMYLLGDTLEKIAVEKAGIIKKNVPVVVGERQKESEKVFYQRSSELNSSYFFASDNFRAKKLLSSAFEQTFRIYENEKILFDELIIGLAGNYQLKNVPTVLQSVSLIKNLFPKINDQAIKNGIRKVKENTGLQGRWQILNTNPLIIADVAHNEAGIQLVVEQLNSIIKDANAKLKSLTPKLHIVFGIVNDKTPSTILSYLPIDAKYYFCKADIPRALDADELKKIATTFNIFGESYPSVLKALEAARKNASTNDIIFIGGSTFVVAEVI